MGTEWLKGRQGKCNLPALTLSADPQFQLTGSAIGRLGLRSPLGPVSPAVINWYFDWRPLSGGRPPLPPTQSPQSVTLQLHRLWHRGENPRLLIENRPSFFALTAPKLDWRGGEKKVFSVTFIAAVATAERSRATVPLPADGRTNANGLPINTTLCCPW